MAVTNFDPVLCRETQVPGQQGKFKTNGRKPAGHKLARRRRAAYRPDGPRPFGPRSGRRWRGPGAAGGRRPSEGRGGRPRRPSRGRRSAGARGKPSVRSSAGESGGSKDNAPTKHAGASAPCGRNPVSRSPASVLGRSAMIDRVGQAPRNAHVPLLRWDLSFRNATTFCENPRLSPVWEKFSCVKLNRIERV